MCIQSIYSGNYTNKEYEHKPKLTKSNLATKLLSLKVTPTVTHANTYCGAQDMALITTTGGFLTHALFIS